MKEDKLAVEWAKEVKQAEIRWGLRYELSKSDLKKDRKVNIDVDQCPPK